MAGTYVAPCRTRRGAIASRSGSERRKVEPKRAGAVRRHEAELGVGSAHAVRGRDPAFDVDADLLEDVARRVGKVDLDDHAPQRLDRAPRPRRVDELRGPRPGRDDHRPGGLEAITGPYAGDATAIDPQSRRPADLEAHAQLPGAGRDRVGCRRRRHWIADRKTARGHVLGDRRLEARHLTRREEFRPELAMRLRILAGHGLQLRWIAADQQEAGRFRRQPEQLRLLLREAPVALEGAQVQLREHRIDRMLDDARVASGCGSRDGMRFEDADAGPGRGEMLGNRHADDAGADDRDVGSGASQGRRLRRRPRRPPRSARGTRAAGRPPRPCCSGRARCAARHRTRRARAARSARSRRSRRPRPRSRRARAPRPRPAEQPPRSSGPPSACADRTARVR